MPDEASYFREQAARCEKLASQVDDPDIRARLMTLATEYARRADNTPDPLPRRRRPSAEQRRD